MSIDWITVAAQIANFLVLVWLLKRFLYRPILDGIDAREAEIASRLQEARQARQEAQTEQAAYHDKLAALERAEMSRADLAREEAEKQRDTLLSEARAQMDRERTGWQAHLQHEAQTYAARMQKAGAGALLSLLRKALADLADDTLEEGMARHLAQRIGTMAADLRPAAERATEAVIFSHLPLPVSAQQPLRESVKAIMPETPLRFATDADQPPGLVLHVGGAQVAWTIDSYVDGLAQRVSEHLTAVPDPGGHAGAR